ncbi:hypothetical protein CYMTET_38345 [Cymbomonas tetramitiformis]|nr:hypothetical protein CYMTET_38345 [Cymbomonas tetramitiformis]
MSGAESRLQGLAVTVAGRPREEGDWNRQLLHLRVAAAGVPGCPGGQQAEAAEWLGPAVVPGVQPVGVQLEVLCAAGRAVEVASGEVVPRRCRRN